MARSPSPVALLLVLVAGSYAQQDPMGDGMDPPPPPGCGWPKVASACPVWDGLKYVHPDSNKEYDISQQDVPCVSRSATCRWTSTLLCEPGMKTLDMLQSGTNEKVYNQLKPGSPAVCGHGNREFSFFVNKGADTSKVLVVFASGGMCWDAESCGNPMFRSMAIDALQGKELAPAVGAVFTNALRSTPANLKGGILSSNSQNMFSTWSVVVIPDCTGDMGIGSRSYTYDAGMPTCITAHHHGGVNTGLAMHWMLENFIDLDQVLLIGTGPNSDSRANGGHGIAFWSTYIKSKAENANVRTVIDSSMGLFGPAWKTAMAMDMWGTKMAKVPDWETNDMEDEEDLLLPSEFHIANDDISYFYEWASAHHPTLSFMDVSSIQDPEQMKTFIATGGMDHDCCLDGCDCGPGVVLPRGERGGRLDWMKTRKVAILRRNQRMPLHYRSWVSSGANRFHLMDSTLFFRCPSTDPNVPCALGSTLHDAIWEFANSYNTVAQDGTVGLRTSTGVSARSDTYLDRYTCTACLAGIPDGFDVGDKCLATMGAGENLFTVAEKYHTDWMALWSLNGDETLDVRPAGTQYKFAHEYQVQAGETMDEIAARFGTTVEAVLDLNYNLITHIQNPERLKHGDRICIVPDFHRTMDRQGNPVCPSDRQRYLETALREEGGGDGEGRMDTQEGMGDAGMERPMERPMR